MRRPFRTGVATTAEVAGLAGFATAATTSPAAAASAPYSVQASGVALKVALAGTSLVGGTSSATAGSSNAPQAQGTGEFTPVAMASQQATASAPGTSQTRPNTSAQPAVPFPAPLGSLVGLGLGCSSASASEDGSGLPTATGAGQVATVSLSPSSSALPVPVTAKSTLASTLGGILGTLPSLPSLPTTGLPLDTVLAAVAVAADTTLTSLVSATLGSSTSVVHATPTAATATGSSSGSKISLLEGLGAGGGALLTVTLGGASATVALDRTTGRVSATDSPAAVAVTLSSPVTGTQSFPLAPGVSQTFLSGTPLATTVAAGAGSATSGTGRGSASADGVTIDAFQGLGATTATGSGGGLDIDLGSVSVSATGTAPVVGVSTVSAPAAPAPAAVTGATTVHTGEFWAGSLPIVLFGLSMLAGLLLIARRRLGSAAHCLTRLARGAASPTGGSPPGPASGATSDPPPVSGPARRQSH